MAPGLPTPRFHLEIAVAAAVLCLVAIIVLIKWASRGWWTGRLLLAAGKPRSRVLAIFLIVYFCVVLIALIKDPRDPYALTLGPAILMTTLGAVAVAGAVEIRERGIFHETGLIPWNLVRTWRWEGTAKRRLFLWYAAEEREVAILAIELIRPRFLRRQVRVLVRSGSVELASQLLNEHVPQAETISGGGG